MDNETFKSYILIGTQEAAATVTGSAVDFEPNNDSGCKAIAIAQVGVSAGTPDSYSVIFTVTQSATSDGSYTPTATFATATTDNQIATLGFDLDVTKPYIKGVATIVFVNGTDPTVGISLELLVAQNAAASANVSAFS